MLTQRFGQITRQLFPRRYFFTRNYPDNQLVVQASTSEGSSTAFDDSKPIILLLGFAGAEYKHLEKYAKFYREKGYPTASYVAAGFHYRLPTSEHGKKIVPLFTGQGELQKYAKRPIIMHVFSVCGARTMVSMWMYMNETGVKSTAKRVKGIIFDSTPGVTEPMATAIATVASTPPLEALKWVPTKVRSTALYFPFVVRCAVARILTSFFPSLRERFWIAHWVQTYIDLPKEQLYIYSKVDDSVTWDAIEDFKEVQKKTKNVETVLFEDSPHVRHYVMHPEQYKKACFDLIERALKETK